MKKHLISAVAIWLCTGLTVATTPVLAESSIVIRESALNGFADHVGTMSGTGTASAGGLFGTYEWEVSELNFDITPDGIAYTGTLTAAWPAGEWNVLHYTTSIDGEADLVLDDGMVNVDLTTLKVPLTFFVPFAGPVTIAEITVTPPHGVETPLGQFELTPQSIAGVPQTVQREYQQGRIMFSGNILFYPG